MVENLISLKGLLSRIKHHMLSFHTHFLKVGGSQKNDLNIPL